MWKINLSWRDSSLLILVVKPVFFILHKDEKTDKRLYIYLQLGRDRTNTGNYLGWEDIW